MIKFVQNRIFLKSKAICAEFFSKVSLVLSKDPSAKTEGKFVQYVICSYLLVVLTNIFSIKKNCWSNKFEVGTKQVVTFELVYIMFLYFQNVQRQKVIILWWCNYRFLILGRELVVINCT
eukprot:TRINITY_DN5927_c0_g1_i2.p5 TRINITY_DN5927_c0_g1~~TRINITY_DN5927_c0_g1_i2.p5  ORF type:complete len:120 (-),score=3.16 TRINITY_DN5927_c0_g1_i2:326-685(-)